mmetsp:Transcript_30395/g.73321  ORF Transcript_30395/g.73321 Transcript_30395/m.73321 type:complete len:105 (+) Transcript_30395:196-510(+)
MDGLNVPLETSTYQETVYAIMDDQYNINAADGMIVTSRGGGEAIKTRLPPPPKDDWTMFGCRNTRDCDREVLCRWTNICYVAFTPHRAIAERTCTKYTGVLSKA